MKLYGLTGGIASGKSAVTSFLREQGYDVMDLDQISRDVVQPESEGLGQVIEAFGAGYMSFDGTLNRKKLAELVFNDKRALERLDNLMGPFIWNEVIRQRECFTGALAFLDGALLIEQRMHDKVDGILLVTAPEEVRLRRAMARDGATEAHIKARMAAQMNDTDKENFADFVIKNEGTLPELFLQVEGILDEIHESL